MAKLIKNYSSKCVLLIIAITIIFCISTAFNCSMAYAEGSELPKDTLLVKGAKVNVPWEYGYYNQNDWQAYDPYKQGTPLARLGNYDGTNGSLLAWTTTIENFKKCGTLTKISLIKTESESELYSITATDPKGIQMSDFPTTDINILLPGGPEKYDYNWDWMSYDGIQFQNVAIKNAAGDLWNDPYAAVRDINTYVSIQGSLAAVTANENFDFTVILYFNGAENGPVIPDEVQDVIDLIDAIAEPVTLDSEVEITAAQDAYDELKPEQQAQVTNYNVLLEARLALAKLKLDAADSKISNLTTERDNAIKDKNDLQDQLDQAEIDKKAAQNELQAIKDEIAASKLKVTGLKVTSKAKKFTITWKKNAKAEGYQIQYKLKSAKKFSTLKTLAKTKFVSKKLKKGKMYQFKVRTYKTVNGKKTYGKWTKAKAVKCR